MRIAVRTLVVLAIFLLAIYWVLTQPLVYPVRSEAPSVEASRLRAHVQYLSEEAYPRSADQVSRLNLAASYIEKQLSALQCSVEAQNLPGELKQYRNILAKFGPDRGPILVVGAHYDSHGIESLGARFPQGFDRSTHTPGADDNASGVAALIELARLLSNSPPTVRVELVFYTLEEPPYFRTDGMGSVQHARRAKQSQQDIKLMISLETIGFFSETPGSQQFPFPGMNLIYPDTGNFIAIIGRMQEWAEVRKMKALMSGASDLPVRSINAAAFIPGVDFSDHRSYWAEGYRAVMITDTAFYRNPHYHHAEDTAEKLDYERMAKIVQGVYAFIMENGVSD